MTDAISTVISASNWNFRLDSCRVVTADFGDTVRVTPDRLLGAQPLNVEVACDAVTHVTQLHAEISCLREEVRSHQAESSLVRTALVATARAPLQAIAGQVLDTAFGFRKLGQTTCTRVQPLPPDNPVVVKLAEMASKQPAEFQRLADGLITRHDNDGAHWASFEALDVEVQICQGLLAITEVKQQYKWEAWVIENYEAIKQAFPAQFGLQA